MSIVVSDQGHVVGIQPEVRLSQTSLFDSGDCVLQGGLEIPTVVSDVSPHLCGQDLGSLVELLLPRFSNEWASIGVFTEDVLHGH